MIKKIIKKIPFSVKIYYQLININRYLIFIKDYLKFKKNKKTDNRFPLLWKERHPFTNEKTAKTKFSRHYIYHPAWAARILAKTRPEVHTDISSTLHFCSIISAFISFKFYDYRPAKLELNNLESEKANLTSLPFKDNSIKSLSCMHTVEHIGLGRYGDPIDSRGDLKAIKELKRILAKEGNLLFVVPVGEPNIAFNAHRIYSYDQIMNYFSDLDLKEFALVPDNENDGGIIYNPEKEMVDKQKYGCGCFWFTKK